MRTTRDHINKVAATELDILQPIFSFSPDVYPFSPAVMSDTAAAEEIRITANAAIAILTVRHDLITCTSVPQ